MSDSFADSTAPRGQNEQSLTSYAFIAVVTGIALVAFGGGGNVREVRVTKQGMLPDSLTEQSDYYIVALTHAGERFSTDAYRDIPIGNGLRFELPEPISLSELAHLCLVDEDILDDDVLEQVEVNGRKMTGQNYHFELIGGGSLGVVGYVVLSIGGAYLFFRMILLVRTQSV